MLQKMFFNNYLLLVAVLSWLAAQLIKTIGFLIVNRKLSLERMVGAGGMPSAHSASVTALLVGTIQKEGASSPLFAVVFVLALVVMYDAMGVRREAGKQAVVLNKIVDELTQEGNKFDLGKGLKEMVGHSPIQVMAGATLGIMIALLMPVF